MSHILPLLKSKSEMGNKHRRYKKITNQHEIHDYVIHGGAKMLLHVKERLSLRETLMIFFQLYTQRSDAV